MLAHIGLGADATEPFRAARQRLRARRRGAAPAAPRSGATGRAGEEHDRVRRLLAEAGGVCAEADREGAGVGWDGGEGD